MKLRNHIFLINSLALLAVLSSFPAYCETSLNQKVSIGEVVVMPDFEITPTMLNDSDGKPITGWKQFIDTNAPKKLILVSGVSFDMHFNKYSTYAISSQQALVEPWPQTPAEVLKYAQESYKWRTTPILFKNRSGIMCISEQDNEYNFEDDFTYSYQGVCLHANKHLAIKFWISTMRSDDFKKLTTEQIINGIQLPTGQQRTFAVYAIFFRKLQTTLINYGRLAGTNCAYIGCILFDARKVSYPVKYFYVIIISKVFHYTLLIQRFNFPSQSQ